MPFSWRNSIAFKTCQPTVLISLSWRDWFLLGVQYFRRYFSWGLAPCRTSLRVPSSISRCDNQYSTCLSDWTPTFLYLDMDRMPLSVDVRNSGLSMKGCWEIKMFHLNCSDQIYLNLREGLQQTLGRFVLETPEWTKVRPEEDLLNFGLLWVPDQVVAISNLRADVREIFLYFVLLVTPQH